jgi:hypothetical protein
MNCSRRHYSARRRSYEERSWWYCVRCRIGGAWGGGVLLEENSARKKSAARSDNADDGVMHKSLRKLSPVRTRLIVAQTAPETPRTGAARRRSPSQFRPPLVRPFTTTRRPLLRHPLLAPPWSPDVPRAPSHPTVQVNLDHLLSCQSRVQSSYHIAVRTSDERGVERRLARWRRRLARRCRTDENVVVSARSPRRSLRGRICASNREERPVIWRRSKNSSH